MSETQRLLDSPSSGHASLVYSPPSSPSRSMSGKASNPKGAVQRSASAWSGNARDVFSRRKKIFIVTCVSFAGFFSPFAINIYIPALPSVAKDLNVTEAVVTLTVTIYMVFQGISPAFWAPLADAYGRRPVYIATFVVFIVACIGLGCANTIGAMLALRALQASGASSVISIGSGTIGDISSPAERGSFMGWFALGQFLGPCVGPVLGGALAATFGFRSIFWFLAILSAIFTLFMIAVFPETLPRIVCYGYTPKWYLSLHQLLTRDRTISIIDGERQGRTIVDDERAVGLCGGRSGSASSPSSRHSELTLVGEDHSGVATPIVLKRPQAPKLADISFLAPYKYLGEWDILMICTMYAVNYGAYYAMTTSQSVLFTAIYNLSPFEIGLTFIPSGVGCALGSVIGGKIVDLHYEYFVIKMKAEAFSSASGPIRISSDKDIKDFPIERARLRAVPWYATISITSLIAYGWCLKKRSTLVLPLIFQFLIGYCSTSMFGNLNTLLVDLYPSNPASATATNNFTRCLFGAIMTASITWLLHNFQEGWTFTLIGISCLVFCIPATYAIETWGGKQRAKRARGDSSI